MKFLFQVIILSIMIITSFYSESQDISFQNLNKKNGLSSNQVYGIFQDDNGVIWYATDRGICSYNGYEFKRYRLEDGITCTTVFDFYPQKDGTVWCSTYNNKIFYFNPTTKTFRSYKYNKTIVELARGRVCEDLYIQSNGTLHLSFVQGIGSISIDSNGKILSKLHENYINYFDDAYQVIELVESDQSFSYLELITHKGLNYSNKYQKTASYKELKYHKSGLKDSIVLFSNINNVELIIHGKTKRIISNSLKPISLGFFDDTHFWIGYEYGGFHIYDLEGNLIREFLSNKSVTDLLIDKSGGLWVSTLFSGIYYTPNLNFNSYKFGTDKNIYSLSADENQNLVVVSRNGSIYKMENEKWEKWFTPAHSETSHISFYQYFPLEHYSVYGEANEFSLGNIKINSFMFDHIIPRKISDSQNHPPILTGAHRFLFAENKKLKLFHTQSRVNDICMTNKHVFMATNNGIFEYDTLNKSESKLSNKLLDFSVKDVDNFGINNVVAASQGGGVLILESNGKVYSITTKDGLASNLVNEVFIQNNNVVWAGTDNGLSRITFKRNGNFDISTVSAHDGLVSDDILDVEVINDTVWVCSREGLSSFPVSYLDQKTDPKNHFLKLINQKVNGKIRQHLRNLKYDENRLEFNYQAISFSANKNLRYRYKLIGLEDKWNYTNNLKVVYESIPPGNYKFLLQVGINGIWGSEKILIPLIILPPYYKTLWFLILIILLSLLIVYLFFRYRILSYNRDIIRELLRHLLKRVNRKSVCFIIRSNGKDIKINSEDVYYAKSLGNYLEIHTIQGKYTIREKISNFLSITPDPIEYIQIRRSYIVRIDKITAKGINSITVNGEEIRLGETYLSVLSQIIL